MDQIRADELVTRPGEGLNVELKRWFNPDEPEGQAKIIRAVLALRNRNGGFLVVGFDDKTLMPDAENRPSDPQTLFHLDKVQGIVSRYASHSFEIEIAFGVRDRQDYPVISVPAGVQIPVASKRDLFAADGKSLIRANDLYFRTLSSNGTPSTSIARFNDWKDILDVCFDNREADIGRFLRRNLSSQEILKFVTALHSLSETEEELRMSLCEQAFAALDDGQSRFIRAVDYRALSAEQIKYTKLGAWEVALVVQPLKEEAALPTEEFLNKVSSSNPQFTGWPVWLDSRGFTDVTARPQVIERAWQALLVFLDGGWSQHLDFMRLDPRGKFYLRRILQDDLSDKVSAGTALDGILVVIRVAETIAVGLSIAKGLGWSSAETSLGFAFRWSGLSNRKLSSWANPMILSPYGRTAHDNIIRTCVEVPLETPLSAISPYVEAATKDLFVAFDGFTMPSSSIENWTQRVIERKL